MKRCIICGNVDDDNAAVCSTCGNPYVDMSERIPGKEEGPSEEAFREQQEIPGEVQETVPEQPDAEASQDAVSEETPSEDQPFSVELPKPDPEEKKQNDSAGGSGVNPAKAAGGRPVRRTRSGPQIYGQTEVPGGNPELYANQGTFRREVPPRSFPSGRPAGQMPGDAGRMTDQMSDGQSRPAGQVPGGQARPANRAYGRAGRPAGQMPGGTGRPSGPDFLSRRVMETARKALRSPLFFLIVLLQTAHVASSIAAIFMNELNYSLIVRLLNEADLPQQVAGYAGTATTLLQKLDSGMIAANIALHIPSILFCLGLWLIFITALTAGERMSGAGFGFARASVIIRMIVACIVMLVTLVITVTVVVAAWVSKQTPIIVMSVIMLVVTIVVVMMVIMYYFAYLATLKTCRVNSNTGEGYGKLSGYVAVMHVILAIPGIVGLLSGIVNMEITGIVGSAAKIGWMILLAVWIFLYRGKMSELED